MRSVLLVALVLGSGFFGCAADDQDVVQEESAALAQCARPLAAANRARKVVVSHSFGENPRRYEVLDMSAGGELTKTGTTFEMGEARFSPIVFTPDGKIGLVAQDDGTVGVFKFDDAGMPVVQNPGLRGTFYARSLVMHPDGNRVFVIDANTAAHGGGVYELTIGCDGTVSEKGAFLPGSAANAMAFMPGTTRRAVVYAKQALDSAPESDMFLVDMNRPSLLIQGAGFMDSEALVSSMDVTDDSKYAIVADDSFKAGDRVSIVSIGTMKVKQTLETRAPFAIVMSALGNGVMVVNGDSADHVTAVRYDRTNTESPFTITGPVDYQYGRPQLPGAAVQITRGSLKGRVVIAELLGVRQMQFKRSGAIEDVSKTSWDKSIDNIVGTVGVQP